jgi:hypothetical protein
MAMQTDVLAASLSATGTVFDGRTRVKGITITYEADGTVELTDDGVTKFSFTAPSTTDGVTNILIPGQGILFSAGVEAVLADASIVVYYG